MILDTLLFKHHMTAQYEKEPYLIYLFTALVKKKLMNYAEHVIFRIIAFNDVTDVRVIKDEVQKKFN